MPYRRGISGGSAAKPRDRLQSAAARRSDRGTALGPERGHRRAHAEAARLIARRRHHKQYILLCTSTVHVSGHRGNHLVLPRRLRRTRRRHAQGPWPTTIRSGRNAFRFDSPPRCLRAKRCAPRCGGRTTWSRSEPWRWSGTSWCCRTAMWILPDRFGFGPFSVVDASDFGPRCRGPGPGRRRPMRRHSPRRGFR